MEAAQHLRQEAQWVQRGGQGEPAQGAHRGALRWRQPGTFTFNLAFILMKMLLVTLELIQGDPSGWLEPPVDQGQ